MAQNKKTDYMLSGWYMYIAPFVNCKNSKKVQNILMHQKVSINVQKNVSPMDPLKKNPCLKNCKLLKATQQTETHRQTDRDIACRHIRPE